jgi:molybdenum cofactor cytidylyltransferase
MGRPKLLLDLGGQTVIRRTVERIRSGGIQDLVIVVGPEADPIREALTGLSVRFCVNPKPEDGQASSIKAGMAALQHGTTAVLIALGDQPNLPAEVIPRLIDIFKKTGMPIVAPVYRGTQGNPVLFAKELFPGLLRLDGDQGAKSLIGRESTRAIHVPFDLPMPFDVDTLEDYEALKRQLRPSVEAP